jgi:hypothetical protein
MIAMPAHSSDKAIEAIEASGAALTGVGGRRELDFVKVLAHRLGELVQDAVQRLLALGAAHREKERLRHAARHERFQARMDLVEIVCIQVQRFERSALAALPGAQANHLQRSGPASGSEQIRPESVNVDLVLVNNDIARFTRLLVSFVAHRSHAPHATKSPAQPLESEREREMARNAVGTTDRAFAVQRGHFQ